MPSPFLDSRRLSLPSVPFSSPTLSTPPPPAPAPPPPPSPLDNPKLPFLRPTLPSPTPPPDLLWTSASNTPYRTDPVMLAAWSRRRPRPASNITFVVIIAATTILLGRLPLGQCQDDDDYDYGSQDQGASSLFAGVIYDRIMNLTGSFAMEMGQHLDFCVQNAKQAKSREAAARHARETVQARERWKTAKDVAKKHAVGLQTQLSRTFSRKKSVRQDPPKGLGQSSKKEPSNLTKMMQSLEENPDTYEGFHVEIGDKNLKKNMPKGKQMHTRSQIFKYAYGQIEKEKAMQQQNKNLTFSGVISMATDTDIRTRPMIEVAFKDLTLTLKGSKKKLLRSVTGKLMPGRVAAVMGPSGAGKTTFLNALAGKATGCATSGLVLINGKAEPIRSYKKIIGFVPQDDIVHGNLTVEENLWFSARCR
ncbi:hypothetical protein BHE74_00033673 [Ensete ventricosum]|nr:hypothetical protein GW17_00014353 [Ensete ventricosum]RWW59387.1 hypothetical protein BHE74_00033673 [Ensete ventricosum]RZR81309.1 hypothetical protein BHM03_00007502 [Ensete ventricosum]